MVTFSFSQNSYTDVIYVNDSEEIFFPCYYWGEVQNSVIKVKNNNFISSETYDIEIALIGDVPIKNWRIH